MEQTVGYGREADSIYVTTLAKMADVARQTASRTLLRFDEEGVFVWRPAKRGSKGISRLELPALDVTRDAELDVTRAEEALLDVTRDASEPLDVTREGACRNTTSKPFATASDVTSKPFTTASDVVEEHQGREAQEPEILETKDLEQEDRGLGLDLPGRLTQSGAHTPEDRSPILTPQVVRNMLASDDPRLRALGRKAERAASSGRVARPPARVAEDHLTKTCSCGSSFEPAQPWHKYCSAACRVAVYNASRRGGNGKTRTKRQSRRATPTQPRAVEKLVGTQLWMTDSSVACCTRDGCYFDQPCPVHKP